MGRTATIQGDRLDHFLSQADLKINYYDSMWRQTNPYNPKNMLCEFNIDIVEDNDLVAIRDRMRNEVGVKVDEVLVVEGCESDDKVVLGGKDAFLNHFCGFFQFNICYSNEKKAAKKISAFFNDSDRMNKKIEDWIANIDKKV